MRSRYQSNLRVGLLSDEVQAEDERRVAEDEGRRVEEAMPEEPAADSLEADLIEIQDTEAEGEAHDQMVEDAVETHEALENLVLDLQASMESGGLSRDAARIATSYASHLLAGVGLSQTSRVMPGLESFGGVASRSNATRLGMESIAEQGKQLWQRILAQIGKAADWVRNYLLQVFSAGDKVLKRAEAMKAALANFSEGKPEGDLDRPQVAKAVSIKGKPDVGGLKVLEDVTKGVLGVWPDITGEGGKAIADFMAQAAENKAPADLSFPILAPFSKIPHTKGKAADGFTETTTDELPGGMVLRAKIAVSKSAEAQAQQDVMLVHGGGAEADGKLPVLKKSEMQSLVNDVISIAKMMVEYRHEANKFDPIAKSLKDSAKKLSVSKLGATAAAGVAAYKAEGDEEAKKAAGESSMANSAARNATARLAQKSVNLLQGVPAKFYAYGTNALRAYLDWAQLSMKAHGGTVDKKAAAAQAEDDKKWAADKKAAGKTE